MEKRNSVTCATVKKWVEEFPELLFDGINLLCTVCNVNLVYKYKSHVTRHIASTAHINLRKGVKQSQFNTDLLKFMVGCNIPWRQLERPEFRDFIENCISGQYGNEEVPGSSTLRQDYLPQVPENIVSSITSKLKNKYIWLSLEETTNGIGSKICNVSVGALEEQCATTEYLLVSKFLGQVNSKTISTLVNDSLRLLWGNNHNQNKDKFLLFITDGLAYMKVAGRILQEKYNCLHVTCFVHSLHRVAGIVRELYPSVDLLISSVTKVFKKAPERVRVFCELHPDTQLPPQPFQTRWGTWIEAAIYYFLNLEKVKQVLRQLDASEAAAIADAQEAAMDPTVKLNLQEIFTSYTRISEAIQHLEQRPQTNKFSLIEQMNIMYDLRQHLSLLQVESSIPVQQKLDLVLQANPGFTTLTCIERLLRKQEVDFTAPNIHQQSLCKYQSFRYAPVTSIDTEHSFCFTNGYSSTEDV